MADATVPRYELGLSLSGAISAGAYSAGVVDFLLQALDEWAAAGAANATGVPTHAVGLKVMSGASAGAITAAVAALALAGTPDAAEFPPAERLDGKQKYKYWFGKLYDTWVVRPTLVADPGVNDLLTLTDLTAEPQIVRSVLNATLLDDIAAAALDLTQKQPQPRDYVSGRLHIYLTLSNLRGTPYVVPFDGGSYGMTQHGDRAHYVVEGIGTQGASWDAGSPFADDDAITATLAVDDLFKAAPALGQLWYDYGQAALASAAFPVGLAPRLIGADPGGYSSRKQPLVDRGTLSGIAPAYPPEWLQAHPTKFTYGAVDGGVIDNDPFEYVLATLMSGKGGEKQAPDEADKGVIMIAPFPALPVFPPDGSPSLDVYSVYTSLMPVLMRQVRFKPEALALAADKNVCSRFLIAPKRIIAGPVGTDGNPTEVEAAFPIASGLLGGFGGFVARAFRDHDFQLGRRNCQQFLKTRFWLSKNNPIVRSGYAAVATANEARLPVIPLLGSAADEVPATDWPRIRDEDLTALLDRLRPRLRAVASGLLQQRAGTLMQQRAGHLLRLLATAVAPLAIGSLVDGYVRRTILADLVLRDQIAGWDIPADWTVAGMTAIDSELAVRQVISQLIVPGYDLRSLAGLATACHLSEDTVQDILNRCVAANGKPYQVWDSGWTDKGVMTDKGLKKSPLFCLVAFQPNQVARAWGPQHAGSFFFSAQVDPPGV